MFQPFPKVVVRLSFSLGRISFRRLKLNRILAVAAVLFTVLLGLSYLNDSCLICTPKEGIRRLSDGISVKVHAIQEVVNPPKVPPAYDAGQAAYLDNFEIPDLIPGADGFIAPLSQIVKLPEVTIEEIRGPSKVFLQDFNASEKRKKIREMTKHAWSNYVKYAWGHNELRPLSKTFHDTDILGRVPLGATIVDSIDTLYIMGLEEEYKQAADWIRGKLDFSNAPTEVSVFEVTIRFVGGLLSIYSMTRDKAFLDRSVSILNNLLPAFDEKTGLPASLFNLRTKNRRNYNWASNKCHILSEIGSLHMEFQFVSELTGDPKYSKIVHRIRDYIDAASKVSGNQFRTHVSAQQEVFCNRRVTLSGEGDSFFEYLLKEWIRTGHADTKARELYDRSLESFEHLGMLRTSKAGSFYVTDSQHGSPGNTMGHLACFAGGMFALGAAKQDASDMWFLRGKQLTETCHKSYAQTETNLGPESFRFTNTLDAVGVSINEKHYFLRPETVESYFYMWRFTHDNVYREYAWDVVQALEKHCRSEGGFSGLKDVTSVTPTQDDVQQSFFLAETLKYLYLIFCDDSVLPLNRWVFNTEGHPFPVMSRSTA
ncbi:mannosyl oligosaccharide 12 alpha mannosidase [Echinococcus multilocularis]|uniref:alpha-1,2-Mannosidase n=1 Tax=Echinococcus multilocularis TaxID=6211 RepID=A0A068Y8V2_ECHMU|nr:mannosyl oligosaccharide 12 alpha mannosidase [Echinococcus multilocularis]